MRRNHDQVMRNSAGQKWIITSPWGIACLAAAGLASMLAAGAGCSHCSACSDNGVTMQSYSSDCIRVSRGQPRAAVAIKWYTPDCAEAQTEQVAVVEAAETTEESPQEVMFVNPAYEKADTTQVTTWESDGDVVAENSANVFTEMTLKPGKYTFEYEMPWRHQILGGELWVREPDSKQAEAFARHVSMIVNPGGDLNSVLTEDDLMQVAGGDMVTKVVFVANLRAIDDRIAYIDRELERLANLESRLASQQQYWSTKRSERRRNAMAPGEQGWGEDVPAIDLAFYQVLVGSERYHLDRFNSADNMMHTYEQELDDLRLPQEILRAERSSLKSIMGSVRVLNRSGDLVIATPSMTQQYHDPIYDIARERKTLGTSDFQQAFGIENPREAMNLPYFYSWVQSSYLNLIAYPVGAGSGLKGMEAATKMEESCKAMGEVLFVIQVGPKHSTTM